MYILIAILMFGFLIFIHELGHFISAKLLDVQVNEFAICMGPVLWQKKKGETTYSLRAIPIGGFCAMEGEDEESDNPRAFPQKSWWRRLVILAAGSFMNYLAGFLAIVILYTGASSYSAPIITDFFEGCPLEASDGLQVGDELYKIDGRRVYLYSDVGTLLSRNKTGVYDVVVKRNGELVELPDFSMKQQLYDVDGVQEYKYGLYFGSVPGGFGTCLKYSWYTSLDFARHGLDEPAGSAVRACLRERYVRSGRHRLDHLRGRQSGANRARWAGERRRISAHSLPSTLPL